MDEHLDDAQRVLERRALRNVRGLLDKLEAEDRDRDAANRLLTVVAVAIVAVAAVAILATSSYRRESRAVVGAPPLATPKSGTFQILHMGASTGEFVFIYQEPVRGREVIEVDAGPGGDLKLAMVKRMVQLIRSHYGGDFEWESARLRRVAVLSARPKDNDGLEDFLMKEFFGTSSGATDGDAGKVSGAK